MMPACYITIMATSERSDRVYMTLTKEQYAYLEKLAKLGIHGKSVSEVSKSLISREIERLITEGFIKL